MNAPSNVRGVVEAMFRAGQVTPRNRPELDLSPLAYGMPEWKAGDGFWLERPRIELAPKALPGENLSPGGILLPEGA